MDNKKEELDLKDIKNYRQRELMLLEALPLDIKIAKSLLRIEEFVRRVGVDGAYISYSGGKDSTVLLHLVRSLYPNMVAVFCDTGLEYPELKDCVKKTKNVITLRPDMGFKQVIEKYGYPMITKQQALYLHQIRRTKSQSLINLRVHGIRINGEKSTFKLADKWKFMIEAPFKVSDKCCDVMKKRPFKKYEKETGKSPILGTMTSESSLRKEQWLRHGCNSFDGHRGNSKPLSFWNEQDILAYIQKYNLKIPSVYGDIVTNEDNKLATTGVKRTGCVFCGFGVHLEKEPNRYQMLQKTHPTLHKYCMDKLGFREVCNYMNIQCEDTQYNFFDNIDD